MIRIRKRAVPLSTIPTPPSDPASILPYRSQKTSPWTVQLPASDDTAAAVNQHSQPLDLHVLGPHLYPRTTLESPLMNVRNGSLQPPQVQHIAEVKPSLIHGGEEDSIVDSEKGDMEKIMRSIFEDEEDERKETEICQNCSNYRKPSLSSFDVGAKSDCKLPPQPPSSSIKVVAEDKQPAVILTPPVGRWLDVDKNMPLKKRKASFEMIMSQVDQGTKKMTMMMSKTNKKVSILSKNNSAINVVVAEDEQGKQDREKAADDDDEVKILNKPKSNNTEVDDATHNKKNTTISKRRDSMHKKTKRCQLGSSSKKTSMGKKGRETMLLMQGSRCSRVNGRRWRCSQPTLVGYSLCEHHLGKGRLIRSISCCTINRSSPAHSDNIKHRSISPSSIIDPPPLSSPKSVKKKQKRIDDAFDHDGEEEEIEHTRMTVMSNELNNNQNKKKVKLGRIVKARSLSSLLGQLNTMVQLSPTTNGICK